tara:strand:+ start:1056 stop:1982 length:927 start_codon:yes stop_codon:yes gene_type:complete
MLLKKGSSGHQVVELQEGLEALGYELGSCDGSFGPATEKSVKEFQISSSLKADGMVGRMTMEILNKCLEKKGLNLVGEDEQNESEDLPPAEKLSWVKCPADKFPGRSGYTRTTLRSDAAVAYNDLYKEVHELGGIITSAGGRRGLASKSGAARSKKSFHYTGLAFDMALPTGMYKPEEDPYVIEDIGSRLWRVWMRCNTGAEMEIEGTYVTRSKGKTKLNKKKVAGKFIDFTAIALKHGFHSIRARRSFFRGGSYGGSEWWHFQYERALTKGESKFGEELLKVYSLNKCKRFIYWNESKDCTFGKNWF